MSEANRDPFEKAKELGFDVILPTETELFIDIDSEEAYTEYLNRKSTFEELTGLCIFEVRERVSNSGLPHRHCIVDLEDEVTQLERIALQALLGSDSTREMLAYKQYLNNAPVSTCFFEKKNEQ